MNFPFPISSTDSQHPEPRLQRAWEWFQLAFIIFPWFPILAAVGIALALIDIWRQEYRTIIRRPLNWGLAILSLWLIISSCFAWIPTEAFLGLANLPPFFVGLATYNVLIQTPGQLRRLAWILVIPSVLVVILGFGQMFLGWSYPEQWPALFGWVLEANGNPPGRMASVFIYANILAAYLQMVLILGLGLWIERFQAWRLGSRKSPDWMLWFLTVLVIGNAIALVLTSSRNAWGIAFVACLAFALYLGWHWLVVSLATAAGSILWASFGAEFLGRQWLRQLIPAYFWARLSDQLHPDRPIALLRTTQWQFTLSMTQERPWLGWGLRNFTPLYEAKMGIWLGHPHNLLLMLAAETGIPAVLLLCSLIGWIMVKGVQLLRVWSTSASNQKYQDQLILFTYLLAFGCCTLFNLVDVTLFDLRVNSLSWVLLSAICGVVYRNS
ncbi:MAG: O-antigen ligase family protein [Symploca sp. SIO2E6]|nr:O-antigen ligase family protein [Symploca sp. SIO2E6]